MSETGVSQALPVAKGGRHSAGECDVQAFAGSHNIDFARIAPCDFYFFRSSSDTTLGRGPLGASICY
jgi:hypothetical protein